MDNEDLKIVELIIEKLTEQYQQDPSSFRCEYYDEIDDFCDDDANWFRARSKSMNIEWHPKSYSNHPSLYGNHHRASAHYDIACQTISISIGGQRRSVFLDGGSNNKGIKIKFVQLFRAVEFWQEKEIPRQKREQFIHATTTTFPDIMDKLILEDCDDGTEEGDD